MEEVLYKIAESYLKQAGDNYVPFTPGFSGWGKPIKQGYKRVSKPIKQGYKRVSSQYNQWTNSSHRNKVLGGAVIPAVGLAAGGAAVGSIAGKIIKKVITKGRG